MFCFRRKFKMYRLSSDRVMAAAVAVATEVAVVGGAIGGCLYLLVRAGAVPVRRAASGRLGVSRVARGSSRSRQCSVNR